MTKDTIHRNIYGVWYSMKLRCYDPERKNYPAYGGRGIFVSEEWIKDFYAFKSWSLSNGYKKGLQLDRIDNDGPYSAPNCRWVTHAKNCLNKRENPTTIRVFKDGIYYTIKEASLAFNISIPTIHARRQLGWPDDQLFIPPLKKGGAMAKGKKNYPKTVLEQANK